MLKSIEVTGKNEEEAISKALAQLGMDRDDVSVELLKRAKSGFLGIGSVPARIKVTYESPDEEIAEAVPVSAPAPHVGEASVSPAGENSGRVETPGKSGKPQTDPNLAKSENVAKSENSAKFAKSAQASGTAQSCAAADASPAGADEDEIAERIHSFLTGLLAHMGVNAEISMSREEDIYSVVLQGKEVGALIGRRGETLDAIQQLTGYAVNHGRSRRFRVHVDAENYRARREESLQHLAQKVAGKVIKYRRNVTLEPMNAYERHVIHTALQDYPGVTTYSTGTEPNRRTVVAYDPTKK